MRKNILQSRLVAVLFMALLGLLLMSGCGGGDQSTAAANPADYAGTYISTKDAASFIELRPDGTFRLKDPDLDITGKFDVSGDSLTLTAYAEFSKPPVKGQIQDGKILDPSGAPWIKQGESQSTATKTQP